MAAKNVRLLALVLCPKFRLTQFVIIESGQLVADHGTIKANRMGRLQRSTQVRWFTGVSYSRSHDMKIMISNTGA